MGHSRRKLLGRNIRVGGGLGEPQTERRVMGRGRKALQPRKETTITIPSQRASE